ncbi:unnamed protein product, partial [Ectocarpus fasciculatus]
MQGNLRQGVQCGGKTTGLNAGAADARREQEVRPFARYDRRCCCSRLLAITCPRFFLSLSLAPRLPVSAAGPSSPLLPHCRDCGKTKPRQSQEDEANQASN